MTLEIWYVSSYNVYYLKNGKRIPLYFGLDREGVRELIGEENLKTLKANVPNYFEIDETGKVSNLT